MLFYLRFSRKLFDMQKILLKEKNDNNKFFQLFNWKSISKTKIFQISITSPVLDLPYHLKNHKLQILFSTYTKGYSINV